MESIPDELVEYLVDEISIDGQLGSTRQTVLSYLEKYLQTHNSLGAQQTFARFPPEYEHLGLAFQTQIWSRLAHHRDITLVNHVDKEPSPNSKPFQLHKGHLATHSSKGDGLQKRDLASTSVASENWSSQLIGAPKDDRLCAVASRTYHVICGGLDDSQETSPAEASLLSFIAQSRGHGVLRSDLIVASGEDDFWVETALLRLQSIKVVKWEKNTENSQLDRVFLARFGNSKSEASHESAEGGQPQDLENGNSESEISQDELIAHLQDPHLESMSSIDGAISHTPAKLLRSSNSGENDNPVNLVVGEPNHPIYTPEISQKDFQEGTDGNMDWTPHPPDPSSPVEPDSQPSGHRGKKKRKYKDPKYKPKGRPRKFVAGTEQFWRSQFAQARKVGILDLGSDPTTHELFTQRPPRFDEVLLRAVETGLPVPMKSQDITQEWVDLTLEILDRTEDGLYLSLLGEHPNDWKMKKPLSQVLIVKSSRLRELDLSDQQQRIVSKARFITSSAAHTFHYLRYYPRLPRERPLYIKYTDVAPPVEPEPAIREAATQEINLDSATPTGFRQASSIEYYPSSPSLTRVTTPAVPQVKRSAGDYESFGAGEPPKKRRRTKRKVFETAEETPRPRATRDEIKSTPAVDLSEITAETSNPFGLPPPLTTRGARRRYEAVQEQQKIQIASFHAQPALQPALLEGLKFSMQDPGTKKWNLVTHKKLPKSKLPNFWKSPSSIQAPVAMQDDIFVHEDSVNDSEFELDGRDITPPPKIRIGGRGGALGVLRRTIVLDIMHDCGGVIPYNATFPGSEFMRRWREEGQKSPVEEKALKMAIKSLIDSGKLKQMKFSFRCKKGNMVIRPLLTNPGIEATHPLVRNLQQSVTDADPFDYVPSGMASTVEWSGLGSLQAESNATPSSPRPARALKIPTVLTLKFQTDAGGQAYRSTVATALSKRRSTRKRVTWMQTPGTKPLPESLDEILQDDQRGDNDRPSEADGPSAHFYWEIEGVMMWEHRTFNFYQADDTCSSFINHAVSHSQRHVFQHETLYRFTELAWFTPDGKQAPYPYPSTPLPDLYNSPDNAYAYESAEDLLPRPKKRRILGPTPITDRYAFPSRNRPKQPYVRRHKHLSIGSRKKGNRHKQSPNYIVNPGGHIVNTSRGDGSHIPIKRQRGTQYLRSMPDEDVYRIAVSVVVIRTLSGGIEKYIDWDLVMRAFPDQDEQFVKDRWKTLSNRYRRDVAGLTESLQEKYLDAFERGEAPGVDFEDLEDGTDWQGICDWAFRELDGGGRSGVEELPGSEKREKWVGDRDFAFEEFKGMRDLLGYNVNATGPRKEEAIGSSVFARPLVRGDVVQLKVLPEEEEANDVELTRARSWVMATVLTSNEHYDEAKIRQKLMKLGQGMPQVEELVDRALKVLQRDKLVSRSRESRVAGVLEGGWEPSAKLFEFLEQKRMVTRTILKDAASFKSRVLDQNLVNGGSTMIEKDGLVEDGHMVALLNLLGTGRLTFRIGEDVPKSRYGLDWKEHGYQTRLLDKKTLGFTVLVESTSEYVAGDPVSEQRRLPVPRGEIDDVEEGRIPMWFDILGNFQSEMWEIVLAAVVGLVSLRAGIDKLEIGRTLAHGMTMWELSLVLQWAEDSGFIQRTAGNGWTTSEWWWLVLGMETDWVA